MRNLMWTALAAGCVLAGSGIAMAQDTIRLGGPSAAAAISGGTNTELVRGYGGGGYRGGYHGGGYHGGYRGGYGHYGHYGYRGYYGHYHNRYYAGYYRPYFYASYWPYYYPRTYGYAYYTPSYYYGASYDDYAMAGETIAMPAVTVQGNYQPQPMPPAGGNLTYPYNGGPRLPVPMPPPEANPQAPRGVVPIDGKLVSLQQPIGGFSVPVAVGPKTPAATPTRVTYPAYGEDPVTSAPQR